MVAQHSIQHMMALGDQARGEHGDGGNEDEGGEGGHAGGAPGYPHSKSRSL